MKKSTCVRLVMLGPALVLGGCDDPPKTLQQQHYASYDDCLKDWGTPSSCNSTPVHPSGSNVSYYVGPRYYWDPDRSRPVIVDAEGGVREVASSRITSAGSAEGATHTVGSFSRGGFGASGHGIGGRS